MGPTDASAPSDSLQTHCLSDPLFRDRYEGWQVLGRGAFATVVRTRSRDTDRDIDLKIFVNLDFDLLERVRQEVSASQRLASPYVVHTYSLFSRGTIAWFEMELVEGPSLDNLIRERAADDHPLSQDEALEIGLALARVVWHAHRHGILHRDLKPSNVIIPRTNMPAAKVTDFGIARLLEEANVTPRGVLIGTPRFASPEALAGCRVGAAHDVYSLGMTLLYLFSGGRLPGDLPSGTPIRALRRLRARFPPVGLETLAPDLDPRIAALVTQCLAPRPQHRPSIASIVTALEDARRLRLHGAARSSAHPGTGRLPWPVFAIGLVAVLGMWRRSTGKPRAGQAYRAS
jgi:eukaryotic-like serine/threonine-protein kinase